MPTIKVTRLDAAKQQLTTALELWFAERDPISVHSLVSAAHQIIHDLNHRKGGPELLFDSSAIRPESKKAVVAMIKRNMNFFKHADLRKGGADDSIDFDPETGSQVFFLMSINGLKYLGEKLGLKEAAFIAWLSFHRPEWMIANWARVVSNPLPVEMTENLKGIPRGQFLEEFLDTNRNRDVAIKNLDIHR